MTIIAFFGNAGIFIKGQQSTVVRVVNIAKKLENYGYTCILKNTLTEEMSDISETIRNSDVVLFHRIQASKKTLVDLNQFVAFLLCKKYGKKVIFDFDDAIFLTYPILTEMLIAGSNCVFAGSHYLYEHAVKLNLSTSLVPSAVDTNIFRPTLERKKDDKIVIGWHGSISSHLKNLALIVPAMRNLGDKYDLRFKLLGTAGAVQIQSYFRKLIPNVEFDFGPDGWVSYEKLPRFMSDIDISVSPLVDSIWTRGKCAMKCLESMSLKLPTIASGVGEHNYIIENGYNGFIAHNDKEWTKFLSMLIDDSNLRLKIGANAREYVEAHYSLSAVSLKVQNLIAGLFF